MKAEYEEFFTIMQSFRKLNISSMLPDISHGEFGILKMIQCCCKQNKTEEHIKVADIVKESKLPPPAVSRTLRSLEQKGLVLRTVDCNDRRNTLVEVTAEGEKRIREIDGIMNDFTVAVFDHLGEESLRKLNRYLRTLADTAGEEIDKRKYNDRKKGDTR